MRVKFWGTRGSLASAGPETTRYGGNTACIEVESGETSLVVLDAGSGIHRLGVAVPNNVSRIDILLSHLHMDHIQGLGFFGPLFWPGLEVHIWGPPSATLGLRDRLTRYLSPPLFPVGLRDLPCDLTLHDVPTRDPFAIGRLTVTAELVIHPGPTVGYRLQDGRAIVVYLPDHEPALGSHGFPGPARWLSGAHLAADADVLIHDAQYTTAEYTTRVGWGHSTLPQAVAFAVAVGARSLVTFHHDPSHDDTMLDNLHAHLERSGATTVLASRDGLILDA